MQVVKRDGTTENVDFSKVEKVLVWAVKGTSVDYREIFDVHNVNEFFFDGIHTSKIQELLANKASTKIVENRDWDVVAARLVLQRIRKEAHNGSTNYISLAEYFDNVEREGNRKLDEYVFNFDLAYLDTIIDQDADLLFTYLGITTLFDRYLLKSNSGKILEAPQHFLMRVAMGLTYNEENPTQRAEELYKLYAAQEFINSTPTLFNSATLFPQLSSCYGNTVKDDSLEGIFATGEELAQCSKFSGGTACDMTPLRAKGSSIGSTGGKSGGIVSYAKLYEQVIRGFDQGGKRPGVVALYLETWHKDIKDFLLSADPSRDERLAVRDVFLATWNSDLFMQRVKDGASWTLFSPSDTPDLNDKWGDEFTEAYERYERELPADKKTVVTAREVWGEIIRCLFERKGKGWPCFKDTSNARNTMRKIGTVHNSNLCTEIILRNSSDRMFVCNLGSINLANVKSKEQLEHIIRVAVRTLDNTISNGFVPTESGNAFNQEDRPLGLGVMGYVELLANFGIDYESSDHVHAAYNLFKFISYIATDESSNLGKEKGNFPTFDKSMWAEGELIQDTSNNPNLTNWMESNPPQGDVSFFEDLVSNLDWEALRAKASRNMRNSHLLAIAPTATIANILGTTSCIELPLKRVYDKSNASGTFFMPSPLHDKYPGTVFDKIATQVDHDWDILSAATRQVWIDQAQSLNVYVTRNVNPKEVSDLYIKGWEYGIKTFYYLKTEAEDVTDLTSKYATPAPVEELELTCEACQ